MMKSKCELWVRHQRKRKFETNRRRGVFYQEMVIKQWKTEAYFILEELIYEYEQMNSTKVLFGVGKSCKDKIKNLRELTLKWYSSVWGKLFTVSTPNLSNRRILRYVKPTR